MSRPRGVWRKLPGLRPAVFFLVETGLVSGLGLFLSGHKFKKMKQTVILLAAALLASAPVFSQRKDPKMDKFISSLMKKMTIEEKIGQLNLVTPGWGLPTGAVVSNDVEGKIKQGKVGAMFGVIGAGATRRIQQIAVEQTRLKIPLFFGSDVIHGHKTNFPIPLGLACSFDMKLIEETARTAAEESTADGVNWTFSPMVDICREPRWGRIAEGSGEDPYLGSQIAAAMVRGYQGDLSKPTNMLSCVKHYALYGGAEAGRDYNTVDMSRQRMFNEYFPPYKAAVDAGCASVMTSFNTVDDVPATGNRWLLTDVLREKWGFGGLVVSDYTSVSEMMDHGMGDLQTCSALALRAGLDLDMVSEGFLNTLKKSLDEGKVSKKEIDQACRRVLEAKWRLGLFENPYRNCDESLASKVLLSKKNRELARRAAANSFVLLKNDKSALPLKKTARIALVGPLADSKQNMLGTWAVSGDPQQAVAVREGIQNVAGDAAVVRWAKGANISDDPEFVRRANVFGVQITVDSTKTVEQLRAEAVELAKNSDIIVACLGESADLSGEASSRSDIGLPGNQSALLDALAATGKPVVLVLFTGRPLTIQHETEVSTAVLNVWAGGTEAGNAVADVLFGNTNPSGKLAVTFPRSVGQVPIYYNHKMTGRPQATDQPNQKFRSNYLDVPNDPLFPFGFGLSFSKFEYSNFKLSAEKMTGNQKLTASISLKNTGPADGSEVVQLYIRDVVGSSSRPVKELKGFQKVFLKKGESRTVSFDISTDDLRFYNHDLKYDWEPGDFDVMLGGNSRDVLSGRVNWQR